MKKLFKVLLSVALVMSFVACGSGNSKRAYDSAASTEAYYAYNDAPAAAYEEEGFYAEDYKTYDNGSSSA